MLARFKPPLGTRAIPRARTGLVLEKPVYPSIAKPIWPGAGYSRLWGSEGQEVVSGPVELGGGVPYCPDSEKPHKIQCFSGSSSVSAGILHCVLLVRPVGLQDPSKPDFKLARCLFTVISS